MRVRRIVNGEPEFGQGRQNFLQGIDAVGQTIKCSLQLYTNEWWEDLSDGLPVWTNLLGYEGSNKDKNNAIISKRILGINLDGTKLITLLKRVSNTYNPVTRRYTFKATAMSIYGPIIIKNGS
jgi:hypothetical protein